MEILARIFLTVLNRGVEISCVILVVLAARLLLLKLPKKYSYFLWLLVAVRIVAPVEAFSLFPSPGIFNIPAVGETQERIAAVEEQFRAFGEESENADVFTGAVPKEGNNAAMPVVSGSENVDGKQEQFVPKEETDPLPDILQIIRAAALAWVLGMAALCCYGVISYALLLKKVSSAVLLRDNIYECGNIGSPFVMGLIRPRIYIPFRLGAQEREVILCHENCHIRRKDYFVKFGAFLVTAVYWFNPLMWLAFFLLTRDMEMSCDERVVMELGMDVKQDYGRILLSFATNRRQGAAGPLAFGEGDTKRRVKNVLDIRKTRFLAAAAAVAVLFAAGVLCLAGKGNGDDEAVFKADSQETGGTPVSAETEAFVKKWAEDFCARNGEGLVAACEEGVGESIPFMDTADGRGFGMSSPWPWGDIPYEIKEITGDSAVIFYYAVTSDPHLWPWREEIKFRGEDGNLLVYEEEMTGIAGIRTAEEMRLLYPDGRISGTVMDYRTNDLGKDLLLNHLLGRSLPGSNVLVHPEEAAVFLLNIVTGETVLTGIYSRQSGERAEIAIYFTGEDEAVLVTMERMTNNDGKNRGIWVPVEIEFRGSDKAMIQDVMIQNTKHGLVAAGEVQYREIDVKLDATMPSYDVSGENPIDGDFLDEFYFPYQRKMYVFLQELADRCDSEDLTQWNRRYGRNGQYFLRITSSEPGSSANFYTFITDFAFTEEEVRKACAVDRETTKELTGYYDELTFSEAEVDVLFSGSEEEITRQFATPYAIVLGKYAYSPLWLYAHTIEDYEAVGITREMVREKVAYYQDIELLPEEMREAFAAKVNAFLGEEVWR
ncbi:MAG: M56 family metallopeptidase [Alistipes sp.]|nr:M56 family metallopeptidase [Alistipes sp.]